MTVRRFKPAKVSGSGLDPYGGYYEFIKKDQDSDLVSYLKPLPTLSTRNSPDLRSTLHSISPDLKRTDDSPLSGLAKCAQSSRINQSFSTVRRSPVDKGWAPNKASFTYCNTPSTIYDPISFISRPRPTVSETRTFDARKSKGLGEFIDISRKNYPNFSSTYAEKLQSNPRVHFKKAAIFASLYGASTRERPSENSLERTVRNRSLNA